MGEYCVLSAEILGASRLIDALGPEEGARGVERCAHRIDIAVSAHRGQVINCTETRLHAAFSRCDDAAQAFSDMLARVQSLPPQRGVRLALRVGLHLSEQPVTDPAVAAVRIADGLCAVAEDYQALATAEFVAQLGQEGRVGAAGVARSKVMLGGVLWDVLPLVDQAAAARSSAAATPASAPAPSGGLRLRHRDQTYVLDAANPTCTFGRERGCNVLIEDKRASRVHARVEWRDGKAYLIDQSSNGTSLMVAGEAELWLRGSERQLQGIGRFGCGFTCSVEMEPGSVDLRVYFEPL